MKKILFVLLTLLVAAQAAQAVPALRGKYQFKQPDGTVITLENHGDEYYHWKTDGNGNTVELDGRGFYRKVSVSQAEHRARYARARSQFRARWSSYDDPFPTNKGDRKILCILAEFKRETAAGSDFNGKYTVSDPYQHFYDMLNKEGYDENGAIGSVRDYYLENSLNQYRPTFDVFGPVTLSHPESYYDQNGVDEAIMEAYELLKNQIVIADYDTDNDGNLDMVLFYYPGHNEAEGAPEWTIWPHQGTGYYGRMGSKNLVRYFCTSELRGSSGGDVAAIGTTCHEFAHSLGLPDFYDVGEAADGGENDITDCTYKFDLMCYGNYNDYGRRPPYLTSLERNMLGWMPMPEPLANAGNVTLAGIENNEAYRINGRIDGEFFLLECRTGEGWDSATAPAGMVVFHVDQSSREIASGVTAASLWAGTNSINAYGGHPCYGIVPSTSPIEYSNDFSFPGRGVTTYSPTDWDGQSVGASLTNIQYSTSSRKVTFGLSFSNVRQIFGHVKDADGQPMQNVTVVRSPSKYAFAAPAYLSTDKVCMTDADGYYSFTLEEDDSEYQVISAQMDGYVSRAYNVSASDTFTEVNFVLLALGEMPPATLKKYDVTSLYGASFGVSELAVGVRFTAAELEEMGAVGATFNNVSYMVSTGGGESVYVIIDIGGTRKLYNTTQATTSEQFVTVDVSDQELVIPAGQDVYIGVALKNIAASYPFIYSPVQAECGGNYYLMNFENTHSQWRTIDMGGPASFVVSAMLGRVATIDFSSYGVSYVKLVDGVPQAVSAAGKTVKSVTWYVDEVAVNGNPPAVSTLSSGAHTYKAVLQHYDGTSERVYYDVVKE